MKISTNQRIIIGFLVLITIYGISGFISARNLLLSKEITTRNSLIIQPSIILLNELELIVVTSKNFTYTWLTTDISDHKDKNDLSGIHRDEYPQIRSKLRTIAAQWANPADKYQLDSILVSYERVMAFQSKIMRSLNKIEAYQDYLLRVTAENVYMEQVNSGTDKTVKSLRNLLKDLKRQSSEEESTMLGSFASIKRVTISLTILSVFIGLIVAFATLRSVKLEEQKRKITAERDLIQSQKAIIEIKNKEITDSINYAKRIQNAILPAPEKIKHSLPEHFIFYRPRDIVSGDFYWFLEFDKETVLIAAADSTGHGVPGAFVSFVCYNSLNRAVKEFGISEPGKILDRTTEFVQATFAQYGEDKVQDGMDIALCSFTLTPDRKQLQYSGANNPICIIRNGESIILPATRQSIGAERKGENFITHTYELNKGDTIYLFTDGFHDQFGGPKNKKYKSKNFFQLLNMIAAAKIGEQEQMLEKELLQWMGANVQVDDILIIGIRV